MADAPTTVEALAVAIAAGSACLARKRASRKRASRQSAEVADPDEARGNPHGLPTGEPIRRLMARTFRAMAAETLASLDGATSIPAAPPDLDHWIKPTAKALAKLTLPYRREAGGAILGGLGVDAADWEPDAKANDARARFAAESIVATTRDELQAALDGYRVEVDAASAKGLRGVVAGLWGRLKAVFRRGEDERAPVIAETEASEAIHAGSVEAVAASPALSKPVKIWVLDGSPCQICISNAESDPVAIGKTFPSGHGWPPAHINCRCSIRVEDS